MLMKNTMLSKPYRYAIKGAFWLLIQHSMIDSYKYISPFAMWSMIIILKIKSEPFHHYINL